MIASASDLQTEGWDGKLSVSNYESDRMNALRPRPWPWERGASSLRAACQNVNHSAVPHRTVSRAPGRNERTHTQTTTEFEFDVEPGAVDRSFLLLPGL